MSLQGKELSQQQKEVTKITLQAKDKIQYCITI